MSEQDQTAVIAFLADPASHGGAAVERIDTHASIVFLAGDRAFKLKRAVRFSYLDYSTLALREEVCRAELALNRRTAPELYEEVCPITRDPDGAPVVRRHGRGRRLGRRHAPLRSGYAVRPHGGAQAAIQRTLMFDLAEQIARFHAAADIDPESGGIAGMAATTASDARNLRAAVPATLDAASVEALIAATQVELARAAPLLDARRRAGKVRHCHGDLHLRNICLVAGRPTLFDCIEFNRLISNIDVLYDLAFLLMDLHARGLDALGECGLQPLPRSAGRERRPGGAAALPVRPRCASAPMSRGRRGRPAERSRRRRRRARDEARRYLAHASDLLKPQPPRLLAIGGLSGTGKSTVAYGLAPELGSVPGARVLRSDVIRKRMFGMAPDRSPAVIGLRRSGGRAGISADPGGGRGGARRRALGHRRRGLCAAGRAGRHRGGGVQGPGAVRRAVARSAREAFWQPASRRAAATPPMRRRPCFGSSRPTISAASIGTASTPAVPRMPSSTRPGRYQRRRSRVVPATADERNERDR